MIDHPRGNYSFIRGVAAYAAGVRAHPGYAIVYARLRRLAPLERGYQLIEQHLREQSRPPAALCGMQLRIPKPLTRDEFEGFNRPYIEQLRRWGLEVDGANPVARTNVAPAAPSISEPMLAGFFYTVPAATVSPTWLIAGVPEFIARDGKLAVAAPGDTSGDGLRNKLETILEAAGERLAQLATRWHDATAISLYTVHDLHPLLAPLILPTIGETAHRGLTLHYGRPPVSGLEIELDAWAVSRELVLDL
ncbi:MAG TPA: hypothetical protein VFB15_03535 [Candidatus Binataceae bacterium]|nr:hypothetical protein [Candidatus Binataceae bacterium]